MKAIRRFTVRTVLPERLLPLERLSTNLRWSWHEPTKRLFRAIDPEAWEQSAQDPVAMLGSVSPDRLAELADDDGFVDWMGQAAADLERYLGEPRWYQSLPEGAPASIAYFSPEYGISEALPQYSGGLGILAGDHLKAASDLGVPLVAVGLFYRAGYFTQDISPDGWQQESYPLLDPDGLPLRVLRQPDGSPARIVMALTEGRALYARIWSAQVGRVPLLLLDTDVPENDDSLRTVTDRLYGGGGEHRLLQELLLGIGGVRALKLWSELMGVAAPEVFHTNEGHAGFLGLERVSDLIAGGLAFVEAVEVVRAGTVFTTHTPVPAGIDRFDRSLIESYFSTDLLPSVEVGDVLGLGAENYPGGSGDVFNMAVMGLRLAQRANGVSKLHGEVSRSMFAGLWPGFDASDVPIASVTNGVHAQTWTDPLLTALAEERLGTGDTSTADWASHAVSDHDLWSVRGRMRANLVADARRRSRASWSAQNPGGVVPGWVDELLDPEILTIGFARRVPTYKRLTLMLHDPERLRALLTHKKRPIQIVIAGKSHPADDEGKRLIQQLVQFAQDPEVRRRIVFLPDYDIGMAQTLYPGTDVWLNNPLRPLEACGTSGMKAALNGSLNLSILDGWWNEFHDGENGWAIPSSDRPMSGEERDALEAAALYDLIEHEVAPRFYKRAEDGLPDRWLRAVRHTLATLSPRLSAERMVREYVESMYVPAAHSVRALDDDHHRAARDLSEWKARVLAAWPRIGVDHVESGGVDAVPQVGDELRVRARVSLGELAPEDVSVQIVSGVAGERDVLVDVRVRDMETSGEPGLLAAGAGPDAPTHYYGTVTLDRPGSFGYSVRVVPRHPLLSSSAELGLIATAG